MSRLGWDNRVGRTVATFGGYEAAGRGDGYLVPVIPKTDFSFDSRAAGASQDVPLAVGIDSSGWVSGVLLVRVHAKAAWTGTTNLAVLVENIQLVPEEPNVVFAAAGAAVATVNIVSGTAAPSLNLTSFLAPIGNMLRVRISYTCTVTQGSANTVSLGVDLIGRPA